MGDFVNAPHYVVRKRGTFMAIHNQVFLYGQITQLPRIIKDEQGNYVQGSGKLTIVSGKRNVNIDGTHSKHAKIEYGELPVATGNPELVETMDNIKIGDIVFIKGNIITRNVKKIKKCPSCGAPYEKLGVITFINPIHLSIEKTGLTLDEGETLLKNYGEVSNVATILGTICKAPEVTVQTKKNMIVKFPLAIDRKYFIADDNPETRTDYPVVHVHGKEAGEDILKRYQPGAEVFLDGCVQYRKYKHQQYPCQNPDCQEFVPWDDWTLDIVPYAIEYIRGWKSDKQLEEEAYEKAGIHPLPAAASE